MPSLYHLEYTLGALECGTFVAICLFGMLCIQIANYTLLYPRDSPWVKALVYGMWLFELAHVALLCITIFHYTVVTYGQPLELIKIHWSLAHIMLPGGVAVLLVQVFLCHRLWVLSRSWLLATFFLFMALVIAGFHWAASILAALCKTFPEFIDRFRPIPIAGWSVGAATDFTLAMCLCFYLRREGLQLEGDDRAGIKKVVRTVTAYTLETGLLTSMVVIASLISLLLMPDNLVWLAFTILPVKLYSNCVLASLNARRHMRAIILSDISSKRGQTLMQSDGQITMSVSVRSDVV